MILYYFLRCSLAILLGLLVYAQTFHFGFVFDDYIFVVTNPFIKNFNNFHIMWHIFPLTRLVGMVSFVLNYHFSQLHPMGYHVFNFMVHLIATALVWALADLLFKITKVLPSGSKSLRELPFIIALIFLVHPGQTQAVTYITQRFESMATMFYLATMYTYLSARVSKKTISKIILFGLSFFFIVLGILTKEVFVTIPAMILVSEWILFPSKSNKLAYIALTLGGVALYFIFSKLVHGNLSVFLQSTPSESHDGDMLTPVRYFLTQMRVFLTFLRILVFPIHQNLDYDYPASTGLLAPPLTLVGLGVIGWAIYLIIKLRSKWPLIAFGLSWVLITFSINLAPRANVIFEHKLYLISFGFILSFVAFLSTVIRHKATLLKVLLCVIIALAVVSFQRNKVWANELTLWQDSIKLSPNKSRVNASLGRMYGDTEQYDQSIFYLSRAIELKPDNITYENRGVIYSLQGKMDLALADLNTSIKMDPGYYLPYTKRAWINYGLHHEKAALSDLDYAIRLEPYFSDAYIERGIIWMQTGAQEKALKDFQRALSIDPLNFDVLMKVGAAYYSLGNFEMALKEFTKARALEPSSPEAVQYLSACVKKMKEK